MKTKSRSPEAGQTDWFVTIFVGVIVFVFIMRGCEGGGSSHRDTLYESATKKIDSGRADQISPQEAKRLDDIMFNNRKNK